MEPSNRRASVLLVEDEEMISSIVSEAMAAHGFDVNAVGDAESALRYLESGKRVDVMFTDVNLPGAMNGAMLAAEVRAMRPEMPIVYTSGRYTQSAIEPLVPRSIFVAKPYDIADVCTLLGRLDSAH
jgi:two-component system, response regulator PdtaR